MLKTLKQ